SGEGEVEGLDEAVQIRGRVVAERLEIDAVEEVQHLQERRPLAPEAASGHLVAAEARAQRGPDLDAELGEVAGRQRPALGAVELGDALRGLAAVELVARCADAGLAAPARLRLGARHPAHPLAELALHEHLTHAERAAIT